VAILVEVPRALAVRAAADRHGRAAFAADAALLAELSDEGREWLSASAVLLDAAGADAPLEVSRAPSQQGAALVLDAPRVSRAAVVAAVEREARRARARATARARLAAFAATLPVGAHPRADLPAAGREGYDVAAAVMDHLAARVASLDEDATVYRQRAGPGPHTPQSYGPHTPQSYGLPAWRERDAPARAAFAARERVVRHLATVALPPGDVVEAEVGRIIRFDTGPDVGLRYTAVPVFLGCGVTAGRMVVFMADSEDGAGS
jgi:hypothetical protein